MAVSVAANKMAAIIRHMLRDREPYRDRNEQLYARKLKRRE